MATKRLAIVTGANQGIGKEIARGLMREDDVYVIATARRESAGRETVSELQSSEGRGNIEFHQLDITNGASIAALADFIRNQKGGKLDILVNNAGMAFKGDAFGAAEAKQTIDTNFRGTAAVTETMLPFLLRSAAGAAEASAAATAASAGQGADSTLASSSLSSGAESSSQPRQQGQGAFAPRIINVCSQAGRLGQVAPPLQARFQDPLLTKEKIEGLCDGFVASIGDGSYSQKGWPRSMYGISKLAEIAYTNALARDLDHEGIVVNAVCPGWCSTNMSSYKGPRTTSQGAATPVWLATRHGAANDLTGGFYYDHKLIAW